MLEKKIPQVTHLEIFGQSVSASYHLAVTYAQQIQKFLQEKREKQLANGSNKVQEKITLLQVDKQEAVNEFLFERKRLQLQNSNIGFEKNPKFILNFSSKISTPDLLIIADQKHVYSDFLEYVQGYLIGKLNLSILNMFEHVYPQDLHGAVLENIQTEFVQSPKDFGSFVIQVPAGSYEDQEQAEYVSILAEISNDEKCPQTAENFLSLIEGTRKNSQNERLYYLNSTLNRNNRAFMQAGELDNIEGEKCVFGTKFFRDECFNMANDQQGIISMCNQNKPHSNNCQFLISLEPMSYIQKKNVAFAKIVYGMPQLLQKATQNRVYTEDAQKIEWKIIDSCKYQYSSDDWHWDAQSQQMKFRRDIGEVFEFQSQQSPSMSIKLGCQQSEDKLTLQVGEQQVYTNLPELRQQIQKILISRPKQITSLLQVNTLNSLKDLNEQNLDIISNILSQNAYLSIQNQDFQNPENLDENSLEYIYLVNAQNVVNQQINSAQKYQTVHQNLSFYKFNKEFIFIKKLSTQYSSVEENLAYSYEDKQFHIFSQYSHNDEYQKSQLNAQNLQNSADVKKIVSPLTEKNPSQNILITEQGDCTLMQYLQLKKENGQKLTIQEFVNTAYFLLQACINIQDLQQQQKKQQQQIIPVVLNPGNIGLKKNSGNNEYSLILAGLENSNQNSKIQETYFDVNYYVNERKTDNLNIQKKEQVHLQLYNIARNLQAILLQEEGSVKMSTDRISTFFKDFSDFLGRNLQKMLQNLLVFDVAQNVQYSDILLQLQQGAQEMGVSYPPTDNQGAVCDEKNLIENWKSQILKEVEAKRVYTIEELKDIIEEKQQKQNSDNNDNNIPKYFEILDKQLEEVIQEISAQDQLQMQQQYDQRQQVETQQEQENGNNLEDAQALQSQKSGQNILKSLNNNDNNDQVVEQQQQPQQQNKNYILGQFQLERIQYNLKYTDYLLNQENINKKQVYELLKQTLNNFDNYQIADEDEILTELLTKFFNISHQYSKQVNSEEILEESVSSIQRCIQVLEGFSSQDFERILDLYSQLGAILKDQNKYKQSILSFQENIKIQQRIYKQFQFPEVFEHLGDLYNYTEHWKQSIQQYKQSLTIVQKYQTLCNQEEEKEKIAEYLKAIRQINFKIAGVLIEQKQYLESIKYYNQALEAEEASIFEDMAEKAQIIHKKGEAYLSYRNTPTYDCICNGCQGKMISKQAENDFKCNGGCNKKYAVGDVFTQYCNKCKDFYCYVCYEKQNPKYEKLEIKPIRCEFCFKDAKVPIGENFKRQKYPEWNCSRCDQYFSESRNNGILCKCNKDAEFKICNPCMAVGENRTKLQQALEQFETASILRAEALGEENELAVESKDKFIYCENLTKEQQ